MEPPYRNLASHKRKVKGISLSTGTSWATSTSCQSEFTGMGKTVPLCYEIHPQKKHWEDTEKSSMKYPSFLHKLGGHLGALQINNCSPFCLRLGERDKGRVLPLNSQVFRKQWYTCQEWTPTIFPATTLSASIQNINLHARYNTRGLCGEFCLYSKDWLMREIWGSHNELKL